jgi:hypothetical protein
MLVFKGLDLSPTNMQRKFLVLCLLTAGSLILFKFVGIQSLDEVLDKFGMLDTSSMNLKSIVSGESINREYNFETGTRRLGEASWFIGYGYNLPENNVESMRNKGNADESVDYHNLYLTLPIYYGWFGAIAYLLMVVGTWTRVFFCYLRSRKTNHFLVAVALGMSLLWGVMLVNEFKISFTRNPSYFMLTWFWLGWTHSVANTLHLEPVH